MMTSGRERDGFSLVEMLIVLALIAALAAVAYPALQNKLTEARAAALARTLDGLNESIQNYRGNVGRFPRFLSQMTTKPLTGAPDLCAAVVPDVNINQWRGPYSSRSFVATGVKISDATVTDTLRRVPADISSTSYGTIFVDVRDTDSTIAALIEQQFDGTPIIVGSYTSGTVQWTRAAVPPAGAVGTLSFGIPVRGC